MLLFCLEAQVQRPWFSARDCLSYRGRLPDLSGNIGLKNVTGVSIFGHVVTSVLLWVKSLIKGSVTTLKAMWENLRTTPLQWMRIDSRLQRVAAFVMDFSLVLDFQSVI